MSMSVQPPVGSPASIARAIGAAPRHRGSSDAWMFRLPPGHSQSQDSGISRPKSATTRASAWCDASSSRTEESNESGRSSGRCESKAISETGVGRNCRRRPAGRSGCDSTAQRVWPLVCRRSSATAANDPLPAKISRRGAAAGESGVNVRLRPPGPFRDLPGACHFAQFFSDALALERREVIDEQFSV